MNSFEKRFIDDLNKYKDIMFFAIICLIAFFARYAGRECQSMDYVYFFKPWFDQMKEAGGLPSLKEQIGNYSLLYQTIIAFMTYIDIECIYQYKILNVIFDYGCAFVIAELVAAAVKEKRFGQKYNIAFAVSMMLPTAITNGAYWGQCDSIYSFFLLLTVLLLYKEKYKCAFAAYGLAFAFKFQAIFMLPFIICCWISKKKFSILNLWVTLVTFWASGIVAYLNGRNIFDAFKIYFGQANDNIAMYDNFSSFWHLFNNDYGRFGTMASLIAITLMGLGLYAVMYGKKSFDNAEKLLNGAAWFLWTAILFMPNMRDRYGFTMDIMLVGLTCINIKYIKFAAVSVLISTIGYGTYLVSQPSPYNRVTALIYLIAWGYFGYTLIRDESIKIQSETEIKTKKTEAKK